MVRCNPRSSNGKHLTPCHPVGRTPLTQAVTGQIVYVYVPFPFLNSVLVMGVSACWGLNMPLKQCFWGLVSCLQQNPWYSSIPLRPILLRNSIQNQFCNVRIKYMTSKLIFARERSLKFNVMKFCNFGSENVVDFWWQFFVGFPQGKRFEICHRKLHHHFFTATKENCHLELTLGASATNNSKTIM